MTYYVIITKKGRAIIPDQRHDYFAILSSIYEEYQSAGSNWDRPNMLLKDGVVVVSEKLSELAYDYGSSLRKAQEEVRKTMREYFRPDWLA